MPRPPQPSGHAQGIRAATFEAFQTRLRARAAAGDLIPLHLGDTWLPPPPAARAVDLEEGALHRYGPVEGDAALRARAALELAAHGLSAPPERTFITAGSTGGLDLALNASLEPGDEVLVLTPSWPLIFGLLQRRGCVPRQVPVHESGWLPSDPAQLRARLAAALGPRTCGIYLCDPNNPAGFVYGPEHLRVVGELALERGLWLYLDVVYIDLAFVERPRPLELVSGPLAERTFVAGSWSKSLGLAGQRVGALVAPEPLAGLLPRLCTHSTYHAARVAQRMALLALEAPDAAEDRARRRDAARAGAELVTRELRAVPFAPPQAGAFVLLDLRSKAPDEAAALALLSACLDAGVSLAPGAAFGAGFERFARLCVTATPLEALREGVLRVEGVLGRA